VEVALNQSHLHNHASIFSKQTKKYLLNGFLLNVLMMHKTTYFFLLINPNGIILILPMMAFLLFVLKLYAKVKYNEMLMFFCLTNI